jgi:hypothetical protein
MHFDFVHLIASTLIHFQTQTLQSSARSTVDIAMQRGVKIFVLPFNDVFIRRTPNLYCKAVVDLNNLYQGWPQSGSRQLSVKYDIQEVHMHIRHNLKSVLKYLLKKRDYNQPVVST